MCAAQYYRASADATNRPNLAVLPLLTCCSASLTTCVGKMRGELGFAAVQRAWRGDVVGTVQARDCDLLDPKVSNSIPLAFYPRHSAGYERLCYDCAIDGLAGRFLSRSRVFN